MKKALIKCTLWNQPAGIVEERSRSQAQATATLACFKLRRWVTLEIEPVIGAPLALPGWDCGNIESILWDEQRDAYAITVTDIFVEAGPADQRDTDFWVIRNAAVMSDWDASERTFVAAVRRGGAIDLPEAKRGFFTFGKSSITKGLRLAA